MSNWNVKFDGADPGPSDDFTLSFVNIDNIVKSEEQFVLVDKYVDDLLNLCRDNDNYSVIGNLKEITSPQGEDLSDKRIYALMGVHTGTGQSLQLGCLLAQYNEGNWGILGLWPDPFAEAVKENNEILSGFLMAFIGSPNDWERVDVVIPS